MHSFHSTDCALFFGLRISTRFIMLFCNAFIFIHRIIRTVLVTKTHQTPRIPTLFICFLRFVLIFIHILLRALFCQNIYFHISIPRNQKQIIQFYRSICCPYRHRKRKDIFKFLSFNANAYSYSDFGDVKETA